MGLQDCMPYLALTRMGEGKSDEELVRDQAWIEGARVWLVVSEPGLYRRVTDEGSCTK